MRLLLSIYDRLYPEKKAIDVTAYGEVLLDMISREEAPLKRVC